MKAMHLVLSLIAFHVGIPARGADAPGTQPAGHQSMLRWFRYSYEINSSYPYLKELPAWSKIPTLLEWMGKEGRDAGIEVAHSQIVALSRADFGHPNHPPAGGLPIEIVNYHKTERSNAWVRWWQSVGQAYGERLRTHGRKNSEAWKLVTRDRHQPLPGYQVTIPDEWVMRTSYRAGDYGGVQTESLTLRRTKEKATLIRALRKSTGGSLEWEQWQPLTVAQADDFAFAVAYAIDNPWLLKPKDGGRSKDRTFAKMEGRDHSTYSGHFQYEFADLSGNIWWNDDPWHWHGAKSTDENFMYAAGNIGSVGLLLWRRFPDNSSTNPAAPMAAGWKPVKMPDATVLQQLTEDLALRGEIIDTLWHKQRLFDGLESLAEFGAEDQIPAISRFEAEISTRVEQVENVLAKDLNGAHVKQVKEWLLTAATKAKAGIQQRSDGQK